MSVTDIAAGVAFGIMMAAAMLWGVRDLARNDRWSFWSVLAIGLPAAFIMIAGATELQVMAGY